MSTFVNTAPKRRSSIHQHTKTTETEKAESLRESLSDLRGSFQAMAAEAAAEVESVSRMRTSTAAKLAALEAQDKGEMKRKKSVVLAEAIEAAGAVVEKAQAGENRRRMSLIVAQAAETVENPHDHHDGCPETAKDPAVVPGWQAEGRGRGASVAAEAAELVTNKNEVKRRGSLLAGEAVKQAIFMGTANQ
ncbi:hypothetical protein TeGR_g10951 [Tetraparma gracilis]|uniref:Uncharacterized protein n=1 Tax=Tetraparma gracilis TaxID=2962635 RepID=A0ABQ6M9U2_9STRA|nr:hypothetical protein TeGR_g10951 [Tetraparma gracilis]